VLRTQPAALRAWQHSRNGTLHGPTPWCTRAPARTLLSLCLRRRSIAVGVVLSGMGPRAEPLIQIVETANDVIMKLARALTLIPHPLLSGRGAARGSALMPCALSPAPAAGHSGPARRAHRAGASAAPARHVMHRDARARTCHGRLQQRAESRT